MVDVPDSGGEDSKYARPGRVLAQHRRDNVISTLSYGMYLPSQLSTWALFIDGTTIWSTLTLRRV